MAEPRPPIASKLLSATQTLEQRQSAILLERLWEKFKDNLDELLRTEILLVFYHFNKIYETLP